MLKAIQTHGGELTRFLNENDANNTLLHYAVKNSQKEAIEFLLLLYAYRLELLFNFYRGMNIDQ